MFKKLDKAKKDQNQKDVSKKELLELIRFYEEDEDISEELIEKIIEEIQ